MQLKALHEQLTAELCAATKATAAAETAAEKRAVAGAEAAKMAAQDNARLRDVNVELVKALKLAQKESKDSQKALAVAETKASKAEIMRRLPLCAMTTTHKPARGKAHMLSSLTVSLPHEGGVESNKHQNPGAVVFRSRAPQHPVPM